MKRWWSDLFWRVGQTAVLVSMIGPASTSAAASSRNAFIIEHTCEVTVVLNRIHERGPTNTSRNRFVVLELRKKPASYVQCLFIDHDSKMICEAASGAYAPPGEKPFLLDDKARATLEAMGYRQDEPSENYQQIVELGAPVQVAVAATLMLQTLVAAYGANLDMDLVIKAPRGEGAERTCAMPAS